MMKPILSQEYLKECLHYDPDTGIFTWLRRPRHHFKNDAAWKGWARMVGKECGRIDNPVGYRVMSIGDISYCAHRLAFIYMEGIAPEMVDHINHVRTDNRWVNLRAASYAINMKNQKLFANNVSGHAGVKWDKSRNKWMASIKGNGSQRTLGRFDKIDEAIAARKAGEIKYGFHENHGKCL